jgi:hypothetical protein
VLAAVCASVVAGWRLLKKHDYTSHVQFLIQEAEFDPSTHPPSPKELGEYLSRVVLSDTALVQMMGELEIEKDLLQRIPDLALSRVREAIELEVENDSFGADYYGARRSARVSLSFIDQDPERALVAVKYLTSKIMSFEADVRRQAATDVSRTLDIADADVRQQLQGVEREQARMSAEQRTLTGHELELSRLRMKRVAETVFALRTRASSTQGESQRWGLRRSFETNVQGLVFELVEPGRLPPPRPLSRTSDAALFGVGSLLCLLPIIAFGVGALDFRLHDGEGVAHIGLKSFGVAPSFQGQRYGSMASRLKTSRIHV